MPLVVVPNTDLLHNHQVELAEILEEQEFVVYGKLEYETVASQTSASLTRDLRSNLSSSISQVEALRLKMKQWPPLRSGEEKYEHGLADVMAEEMGWQID